VSFCWDELLITVGIPLSSRGNTTPKVPAPAGIYPKSKTIFPFPHSESQLEVRDSIEMIESMETDAGNEVQVKISEYIPTARTQALYNYWNLENKLVLNVNYFPMRASTILSAGSGTLHDQDRVYEDLLELMIYAQNFDMDPAFERVVLKKWQETDSKHVGIEPRLELVEKAFKDLPKHHVLLKYLVRHFASVWSGFSMEWLFDGVNRDISSTWGCG
jgi:hypothetical protein